MEEGNKSEVLRTCADKEQLWNWVKNHLGMEVPRKPFCAHHNAPFDYLEHGYFEPNSDVVVWGPRGGGKTRLAAVATLLDLLHKPGISVRILGGSMEQSLRVWEHLLPDLENLPDGVVAEVKARQARLANGSSVAALPQSRTAVRGQRVQKMRCDEVDEFDPKIWRAVGATTRSREIHGAPALSPRDGPVPVRGVVEALSTYHKVGGVMKEVLGRAEEGQIKVVAWCILDVMAPCEPERDCGTCPLFGECRGRAKTEAAGFVPVQDVIDIRRRLSAEAWASEMLCLRPSTEGLVFPAFAPGTHVRATEFAGELSLGVDFGFANPFVALWAGRDADGVVHVVDEWSRKEMPLEGHVRAIRARGHAVSRLHCDPAGKARNSQTGNSDVGYLKSQGFDVRCCTSGIVEGIERIRRLVMGADGRPRLLIHPRCKTLIAAMGSYKYPVTKPSELPDKDGVSDHPVDALRYWLANWEKAEMKIASY